MVSVVSIVSIVLPIIESFLPLTFWERGLGGEGLSLQKGPGVRDFRCRRGRGCSMEGLGVKELQSRG